MPPARDVLPAAALRGLPIVYALTQEPDGTWLSGAPRRDQKIAEVVAGDVVRDIVARGLRVGHHLPTEAAMLAQYDVGRESLREALRILEVQGLITIKRGPGGGPVVEGVDASYLARTSALYFHLSGATYDELFEAWSALEPAVAARVARRPDRVVVRTAMAPYLVEPSPALAGADFQAAASGFHVRLAQISGSRVLVLLLQAVSHLVVEHVIVGLDPAEERHLVEDDHVGIARAIADGRASKAHRLMTDHVSHVHESCRRRFPERLHDLVEWP